MSDRSLALAAVILDTICSELKGCPSGPMYAALMSRVSLEQFQGILDVLVEKNLVTRRGHVYFPTAVGQSLFPKVVQNEVVS